MSGFTTFNAAGFGVGGSSGNVSFNYDPYYTASVPTQNIPGGTTDVVYRPGSFLFNGSTDFLSLINPQSPNLTYPISTDSTGTKRLMPSLNGSGNFTVECWVYSNSFAGAATTFIYGGDGALNTAWSLGFTDALNGEFGWWYNGAWRVRSSTRLTNNIWYHVAYVRSGTTGTLYLNGVSVGSWTDSANYASNTTWNVITMGRWGTSSILYYNGRISQPRITLSALYTSNFVPSPVLGLATETVFYAPALSSGSVGSDLSRSGQNFTALGGSLTYSAFAPADAPSSGAAFLDTSSNVAIVSATAFQFGTANFTVEGWINKPVSSTIDLIWSLGNAATPILNLYQYTGGSIGSALYYPPAGNIPVSNATISISPNSWNHIAFGKSGSNLTLWVNGIQQGTAAWGANMSTTTFQLKGATGQTTNLANLQVGPVRVSNSAVYTTGTNFSPPSTFARTANTTLLLQGGNTLSAYLTDQSIYHLNNFSIIGNVVTGSAPTQYGISGNVIGDISGAQNTGLTLRRSGTGNATGVIFENNYGGYWQFNGNTSNCAIQTTQTISSSANASISTWVQTTGRNFWMTCFETARFPNTTSSTFLSGLFAGTNSGNISFQYNRDGTIFPTISTTGNVADGRWHHVVATVNHSAGIASVYLDGQLIASNTSGATTFNTTGTYTIGSSAGFATGTQPINGNIGPTAVYGSVLTAAQVGQIYRTQAPRFTPLGVAAGNLVLSSTGSVQSFTVPAGITQMSVRAVGGAGGGTTAGGANQFGGAGANILANIAVVPGSTYYAIVGKGGTSNSNVAGTFAQGGGGAGGLRVNSTFSGAQGGGFTGLFTIDPTTVDANTAQQYTVLVAGGGGGTPGAGGSTFGNGGNAAISLTGNAVAGNSYSVSFSAIGIASASSTGNSIVITMSALGNTSANVMSIGAPVGFSGVGGVTAANVYFVSAANNSSITAISSPGSFAIPAAGALSLTAATIWPNGYLNSVAANYQGGGGAYYINNVAYPGGQGFIGGAADAAGIRTATGTVTPAAGAAFAGGMGGSTTLTNYYGGGGGGGGYFGGGGGVPGESGGGGGGNYANTQLIVGNTVAYGTQLAGGTGNGSNGSMTVTWATSAATSANYGYSGDVQTFTVPSGVEQITARVIGGAGGRGQGPSQGGAGANIAANISVTPGQTLYMIVGRGGNISASADSGAGTFVQGGGGAAGSQGGNTYPGAGGGGFSGIFNQFPSNTSVAATSAILIAGGGGGGGGSSNQTNGSNAAISLTGQASQGTGFSSINYMTSGWSSTGTQIVGNLTQVNGVNLIQVAPANYFSTGAAVQLTGVGNVLAGQYLTVASAAGNLVYFNNGNVSPFPNAGNTGGNTAFSLFNFITAWNNTNLGGGIGGGNSALTGGASATMFAQLNSPLGTVTSSATAGSAWQGGNGGNSTGGLIAGGGGGGGGWFGGGGGVGAGGFGGGGGGGGSNYVSPAVFNGVTYGNLTVAASVGVPLHGNIQLSWANTANFNYTTGTVQTFTVPPYVTRLTARVVGAAGGPGLLFQTTPSTYYAPGGGGANISATLTVTPGQTLYVIAGQGGYAPDYNLFPAGNIATGNLTQGGGGGSYNAGAGTPGIGGSSGGGFSGIFTADPTSNAIAANSAVLIAGGGGGGTVQSASSGGNAASTISANASPGGAMQSSTAFLQSATAITSDGTNVTITLSNTQTNKVNYSVGELFSIGGSNIASNWIGKVLTANATTIVANYGGGNVIPPAGTYSAGLVYPGGFNGTGVAGFNNSAGGGSPSFGGYPCPSYINGTLASTIASSGGTQFFGGQNGYALGTNSGGAGGGGWYGGGGGGNGGQAVGPLSGGGGGSNYANAQMVTNVAYGTITTNTNSNNTPINGYVTFSW
jgi:hypothetical protein